MVTKIELHQIPVFFCWEPHMVTLQDVSNIDMIYIYIYSINIYIYIHMYVYISWCSSTYLQSSNFGTIPAETTTPTAAQVGQLLVCPVGIAFFVVVFLISNGRGQRLSLESWWEHRADNDGWRCVYTVYIYIYIYTYIYIYINLDTFVCIHVRWWWWWWWWWWWS